MGSKIIDADKRFITNAIPEQRLTHANQLTIKAWNDAVNILRLQTNNITNHLKELYEWLIGTEPVAIPEESSGYAQYVLNVLNDFAAGNIPGGGTTTGDYLQLSGGQMTGNIQVPADGGGIMDINNLTLVADTGSSITLGNVQNKVSIIRLKNLTAPTTSNGTTYGAGSAGQVLMSNGSNVYWGTINTSSGGTTSGNYLPLTGGTITGDLSVGGNLVMNGGGGISGNSASFHTMNVATKLNLSGTKKITYDDTYEYTFPDKSGTVALLSDITSDGGEFNDPNSTIVTKKITAEDAVFDRLAVYDATHFHAGINVADTNGDFTQYWDDTMLQATNIQATNIYANSVFVHTTGGLKQSSTHSCFGFDDDGAPTILNTFGRQLQIATTEIDDDYKVYTFPEKSGTVALLDDIPSSDETTTSSKVNQIISITNKEDQDLQVVLSVDGSNGIALGSVDDSLTLIGWDERPKYYNGESVNELALLSDIPSSGGSTGKTVIDATLNSDGTLTTDFDLMLLNIITAKNYVVKLAVKSSSSDATYDEFKFLPYVGNYDSEVSAGAMTLYYSNLEFESNEHLIRVRYNSAMNDARTLKYTNKNYESRIKTLEDNQIDATSISEKITPVELEEGVKTVNEDGLYEIELKNQNGEFYSIMMYVKINGYSRSSVVKFYYNGNYYDVWIVNNFGTLSLSSTDNDTLTDLVFINSITRILAGKGE